MNKETYDIFSFGYSRGRMKWFFFAENAKLLSFGHCNTYFLCSKQSKRLYICKCRKCVTVLLNSTLIHSIFSKEREIKYHLKKISWIQSSWVYLSCWDSNFLRHEMDIFLKGISRAFKQKHFEFCPGALFKTASSR